MIGACRAGGQGMDLTAWIAAKWAIVFELWQSFWALAAAWPIPTLVIALLFAAIAGTFFIRRRAPLRSRSPNRQIDQLARIQRLRNSRVIAIIHRESHPGGIAFGGPERSYIDLNDFEGVVAAISATSDTRPLDIILHTEGGDALAALQIARAVKAHPARKTVFVPYFAMSGGTLIALAADEIVMSEHAVLGPVDPQLGEYPAASILKVARQKPIAEVDDRTLILADQAEKAIAQMQHEVVELLGDKYPAEEAKELAKLLTSGTWTHDYPITYERARDLGLRVRNDIPKEMLHLMHLYPQPTRQQPSVEYVPLPYRARRKGSQDGV